MTTRKLVFNGIRQDTGTYGTPPVELAQWGAYLRENQAAYPDRDFLKQYQDYFRENQRNLVFGVRPEQVSQAGWAIIFAEAASSELIEALSPLSDYRKEQVGEERHRLYHAETGYRQGETAFAFIGRHGGNQAFVDPRKIPYYLLLVGGPETIPFAFQYGLGTTHAVGRIAFPEIEDYARYAETLVAREKARETERQPRIVFFGPENDDDPCTELSCKVLVEDLADDIDEVFGKKLVLEAHCHAAANKACLSHILADERPDFLLTASHGLMFGADDPKQRNHQGGLVCSDWPGPKQWQGGPVPEDYYFAAHDLPATTDLQGLVALLFSCFSMGTPARDTFQPTPENERALLAREPFLARLPMAMLKQGAGAVVAHVDQAFPWTFAWQPDRAQTEAYFSCIGRLLAGAPLGWAMDIFSRQRTIAKTQFHELRQQLDLFPAMNDRSEDLVKLWITASDSRNFLILGDPAVRLNAKCPEVEA